jgi:hypothetical protein
LDFVVADDRQRYGAPEQYVPINEFLAVRPVFDELRASKGQASVSAKY